MSRTVTGAHGDEPSYFPMDFGYCPALIRQCRFEGETVT